MGFFGNLFGGKSAEPEAAEKPARASVGETTPAPSAQGPAPELIAAIAASLHIAQDDDAAIAAIAAAMMLMSESAAPAVRFRRNGDAWAASGRQRLMASRDFS